MIKPKSQIGNRRVGAMLAVLLLIAMLAYGINRITSAQSVSSSNISLDSPVSFPVDI